MTKTTMSTYIVMLCKSDPTTVLFKGAKLSEPDRARSWLVTAFSCSSHFLSFRIRHSEMPQLAPGGTLLAFSFTCTHTNMLTQTHRLAATSCQPEGHTLINLFVNSRLARSKTKSNTGSLKGTHTQREVRGTQIHTHTHIYIWIQLRFDVSLSSILLLG